MNDEEALVRSLVLSPDDEGLLSVFFDWLEEHGAAGGVVTLDIRQQFQGMRSYVFVYGIGQVTVATQHEETARWRSLPLPDLLPEPDLAPLELRQAAKNAKFVTTWESVRGLAMGTRPVAGKGRLWTPSSSYSVRGRDVSVAAPWGPCLEGEHRTTLTKGCENLVAVSEVLRSNPMPPAVPLDRILPTHRPTLAQLQKALREEETDQRRARRRHGGLGRKDRGRKDRPEEDGCF